MNRLFKSLAVLLGALVILAGAAGAQSSKLPDFSGIDLKSLNDDDFAIFQTFMREFMVKARDEKHNRCLLKSKPNNEGKIECAYSACMENGGKCPGQ
jgi:hypothetical protein